MAHCRHLTAIPTSEWSAVVCQQCTLCRPADPFCCCHREIARRLNCITETFLLIILSFLLFFLFILLFLLLLSNLYNGVRTLASRKSSSLPNGVWPLPACFFYSFYISVLFNLIFPSFTRSSYFPCSFHCSCCSILWHSLALHLLNIDHTIIVGVTS
jgi:hypothetical protein